ncbi:MAG TPA: methyltransferase domain-containing protein [Rhizomicrobium sp.]|jgi:SAM-dependent methyltransferase|nr:methyltransferase domain-containing protein [Rhizomicrobium sp.]
MFGQKRMMPAGMTAQYCYGVWFKHLLLVDEIAGCGVPEVIAELGPGDTIGVGIAALLSGASRYIGVDARKFANVDVSVLIAENLAKMFSARCAFPTTGWSEIRHLLDEGSFPSKLLATSPDAEVSCNNRIAIISKEILNALSGAPSSMITYRAPLSDPSVIDDDSVDLLISQSVLEHVVDLRKTLQNTFRWLKPGGFSSHQFDLTSHDIVNGWDGHRLFSEGAWNLIVGARPFMLNRLGYSAIIAIFEECGFRVLRADRMQMAPIQSRTSLARSWQSASDDDLSTYGGYVIVQKPN